MSCITETYKWLEMVEERFVDKGIPFSDRQVKVLIMKIKHIEPFLQEAEPNNDLFDHFAEKMEEKFIKEDHSQRYMLFDFIKNMIHKTLLGGTEKN